MEMKVVETDDGRRIERLYKGEGTRWPGRSRGCEVFFEVGRAACAVLALRSGDVREQRTPK